MAESEEERKSLLMRVKEDSRKAGLRLNIKKTKIMASGPIATATKSRQSCPSLCDPIDGSPIGSSVPGILQAKILEWAAISFSNEWKWKVKVKSLSHVRLSATPQTVAYQALLRPWDSPGKSTGMGCHCLLWSSPLWVSEWVKSLSRVWLFVTPWTVAYQAPQSMGFSRQEHRSGLPFPSPQFPYYMANRRGKGGSSDRFPFLMLQNHCWWWL